MKTVSRPHGARKSGGSGWAGMPATWMGIWAVALAGCGQGAEREPSASTQAKLSSFDVTTQHNDNGRTGGNLNETVLTTANVNADSFGKLFTRAVDDQIYTQPLYLSSVDVPGKGVHNVVYVATVNDSVYAFDADDPAQGSPLWEMHYADPAAGVIPVKNTDVGQNCGSYQDFSGNIGIVGTPVIDPASGTMYFVARTKENGAGFVQKFHAIDVADGSEKPGSPVLVTATVPGSGDGQDGTGHISFDPQTENQRTAMLLSNGVVYVAWASHCDTGPYHGWILGYDAATLAQRSVFNDTPNGGLGGIWQAGEGPSADADGNVYVITGNGTFDAEQNGSDYGQSFLKFSTANGGFSVADWFTPFNYEALNEGDIDLGASGALLLPGTNLVMGGGKGGTIYVLDRSNLGHYNPTDDSQIVQSFNAADNRHIHGSPAYWEGPTGKLVYIWAEFNHLRAFRLQGGTFETPAASESTMAAPDGMPGGFLSVSANGGAAGTGILWASHPYTGDANQATRPGILRAFDAADISKELWNSHGNEARDDFGSFAKFCSPTIANGKVYQSTFSNQLAVYGLLSTPPEPVGALLLQSGFEASEAAPSAKDTPDTDYNGSPQSVSGYVDGIAPECSVRANEQAHSGQSALMFSGAAQGGQQNYDYYRVFDANFTINASTSMRYWLYPEQDNGRYVSLDLHCTDGRTLRDSGATSWSGAPVHPSAGHGGDIPLGAWTRVSSNIGNWLTGCKVDKVWLAFDRPGAEGQYRGYVDDLLITHDPLSP